MPLALFTVPVFSTLLGGLVAIRLRRYLHLLIALGAGLLLGTAFLDLLPEALTLGSRSGLAAANVLGLTLLSFLLFHGVDAAVRYLGREPNQSDRQRHLTRRVGAGMLIFHSFRDGMAIGAAYTASHAIGYAVACGIAAHDLGDGMNTVILTTGGDKAGRLAYGFLLADAIAPLLGGALTFWWGVSARGSVFLLVLAAGFFLQMATGDYLLEMRNYHGPKKYLFASILLGTSLIYGTNMLLGLQQ